MQYVIKNMQRTKQSYQLMQPQYSWCSTAFVQTNSKALYIFQEKSDERLEGNSSRFPITKSNTNIKILYV